MNEQVTAGIAVYGNGGMNTNYKNNPYAVYDNTGSAGISLTQAFISPALSEICRKSIYTPWLQIFYINVLVHKVLLVMSLVVLVKRCSNAQ